MLDLSDNAMAAWSRRLPPDILAALGDEGGSAPPDFVSRLEGVDPVEASAIVVADDEAAGALGRPRRIRLAAWLVSRAGEPDRAGRVVDALTGEDDEGQSSGGCRVLFLEDLRALNEALAARIGARIAGPSPLVAATEAAVLLENEIGPGGGMR